MKKSSSWIVAGFLLIVTPFVLASQSTVPKMALSFLVQMSSFSESGSTSDYSVGVNEFPITSSHSATGFGLALSTKPRGPFSIGLEIIYNSKSDITITDTSDNDTAQVKTCANVTGLLSFTYRLLRAERYAIFLQGGGGGYYLMSANPVTYTTALGYELQLDPPSSTFNYTFFGGAGGEYNISNKFGVVLSLRYLYMGADIAKTAFVIQGGFRLMF